jgi:hypothetical protein
MSFTSATRLTSCCPEEKILQWVSCSICPSRHIRRPANDAVRIPALNSRPPCCSPFAPPTMPSEILAAAARWQRRSSNANRLCCTFSPNRQKFARQYARILIPTDSAVRVRSHVISGVEGILPSGSKARLARLRRSPSDTGESTTDGNDLRKAFTVNFLSRETFASREHRPA